MPSFKLHHRTERKDAAADSGTRTADIIPDQNILDIRKQAGQALRHRLRGTVEEQVCQ